MNVRRFLYVVIGLACVSRAAAQVPDSFIIKTGEGEAVLNGILIKVSPNTGSEKSVLLERIFQRGQTTDLHAHDQGDEILFIVSGKGNARVGEDSQLVEAGDVIFVSRGHAHQVGNLEFDDPLRVLSFMDSPELAEGVRAVHEMISSGPDGAVTNQDVQLILEQRGASRTVIE